MIPSEVKALVQSYLYRRDDQGKTIRVVGEPMLIDGQWQVSVEPKQAEPTPRYHYYEILGEVEDSLSESEGVSVFLTPAPEGTYTYKIGESSVEVKRREESLYVAPKGSGTMFAVYDLDGQYESSNVAGGMSGSDVEDLGELLSDWRLRFDEAICRYIDERKKVAA